MIIIKIQGGLGNQMFQYAFGRNLSLLSGVSFTIDSSYLRKANQSNRSFVLDNFNTRVTEASSSEIQQYCGNMQKILDKMRRPIQRKKVVEPENFNADILKRKSGYFDGFWNNEKYFKNNWETIKKDFTLKKPLGEKSKKILEEIELKQNSVSVHIRRGDYLSISKIANVYVSLPFSYYKTAMDEILKSHPDAHFFISSDDIGWVKDNFPKEYRTTFLPSEEIPDYEEIILMSRCEHNIIANSTFSWWAAYLNQNPGKIVIAPKNWFKDESKNKQDLILDTWIQM